MANEITRAQQWIYNTLTADSTLTNLIPATRMFWDTAPEGTVFPFIIYSLYAAHPDTWGIGSNRVWSSEDWLVRVIDNNTGFTTTVESASDRIDTLLHGKANQTLSNGSVISSIRQRPFGQIQDIDTKKYVHLGGVYWLLIKAT